MRVVIQAVMVALLTAGVVAQGDLPKSIQDAKPVTLQFQNAALQDALGVLGRATGVEIRIAPDVDTGKPINMKFTNAKVTNVFSFIITASNLTYTVVDDHTILVISKR